MKLLKKDSLCIFIFWWLEISKLKELVSYASKHKVRRKQDPPLKQWISYLLFVILKNMKTRFDRNRDADIEPRDCIGSCVYGWIVIRPTTVLCDDDITSLLLTIGAITPRGCVYKNAQPGAGFEPETSSVVAAPNMIHAPPKLLEYGIVCVLRPINLIFFTITTLYEIWLFIIIRALFNFQ